MALCSVFSLFPGEGGRVMPYVTEDMLVIGKQRGTAGQSYEISIGYSDMIFGVGVGSIKAWLALLYKRCCCNRCPRACHSNPLCLSGYYAYGP